MHLAGSPRMPRHASLHPGRAGSLRSRRTALGPTCRRGRRGGPVHELRRSRKSKCHTVGTSAKKPACRQVPHGSFLSPDGPGDPQTPWDTSWSDFKGRRQMCPWISYSKISYRRCLQSERGVRNGPARRCPMEASYPGRSLGSTGRPLKGIWWRHLGQLGP